MGFNSRCYSFMKQSLRSPELSMKSKIMTKEEEHAAAIQSFLDAKKQAKLRSILERYMHEDWLDRELGRDPAFYKNKRRESYKYDLITALVEEDKVYKKNRGRSERVKAGLEGLAEKKAAYGELTDESDVTYLKRLLEEEKENKACLDIIYTMRGIVTKGVDKLNIDWAALAIRDPDEYSRLLREIDAFIASYDGTQTELILNPPVYDAERLRLKREAQRKADEDKRKADEDKRNKLQAEEDSKKWLHRWFWGGLVLSLILIFFSHTDAAVLAGFIVVSSIIWSIKIGENLWISWSIAAAVIWYFLHRAYGI